MSKTSFFLMNWEIWFEEGETKHRSKAMQIKTWKYKGVKVATTLPPLSYPKDWHWKVPIKNTNQWIPHSSKDYNSQ